MAADLLFNSGAIENSWLLNKIFSRSRVGRNTNVKLAITSNVAENYDGGIPVIVCALPLVVYDGKVFLKKWYDFALSTPFDYDGVSNLLIEFEMNGDSADPGSVSTCAFATKQGNDRYIEIKDRGQASSIPHPGAIHLN